MSTASAMSPRAVRHTPASEIRPRGAFASAVGAVLIASLSLAVLSASGQQRQRSPLALPPAADVETVIAAKGYAVTGAIATLGADEQTSTAGRWRVQGRILPSNDNDEPEPAADTASVALTTDLCVADVTTDGRADIEDLLMVLNQWGGCPATLCDAHGRGCPSDVDGDGIVSGCDLAAVLRAWQESP